MNLDLGVVRMHVVTTVLEVVGGAAIVAGVALVFVPAALIVGGALLVLLSWALTSRGDR